MRRSHARWMLPAVLAGTFVIAGLLAQNADSMCGYFRPVVIDLKNPTQVLQPGQIAFITYDPESKVETVTVQPRFEGNARDFAMVIPTPSQPKLHEMPRDFFKALEVFTAPKQRAFASSKLVPFLGRDWDLMAPNMARGQKAGGGNTTQELPRPTTVKVREVGQVGNLDYKIITADRPDDLTTWLKDNKYSYAGDEATLNYYVQRKYFFTVMKIDTLQMKKNKDGTYTGDVTPTRFTFKSEKLVYPLRITQVSVKDKTDAMFYVQAPTKFDLPGDMSYQYQWVSMLNLVGNTMGQHELAESTSEWHKKIQGDAGDLLKRGNELGFNFQLGARLPAGKSPTTLNWAKKLTAADIGILAGTQPYSERVPDVDDGFTTADMRDPQKNQAIIRVIQKRLEKSQQDRPNGYLVRTASAEDLKLLPILKGHLQEGQFLTCFRHEFSRAEMGDDLVMTPAMVGNVADVSEHEHTLRVVLHGRGFRGNFDHLLPLLKQ